MRPSPVLLRAVILIEQRGQVGVRKSPLVANLSRLSAFSGSSPASFSSSDAPSISWMFSFAAKPTASGVNLPVLSRAALADWPGSPLGRLARRTSATSAEGTVASPVKDSQTCLYIRDASPLLGRVRLIEPNAVPYCSHEVGPRRAQLERIQAERAHALEPADARRSRPHRRQARPAGEEDLRGLRHDPGGSRAADRRLGRSAARRQSVQVEDFAALRMGGRRI